MYTLNEFTSREQLDLALAEKISAILSQAIALRGKASIAVSGGSTPKGLFKVLSNTDLAWDKVTVTLADERWVDFDSDASNTKLVFENLLQNKASKANFFHLKQGESLCNETLDDLNIAASNTLLPLDVLILGMGEDGHTASLFPCSEQIAEGLSSDNKQALMKVVPTTAPHERITFTYAALADSKNVILHVCGDSKKAVLAQANAGTDTLTMPIRAFLQSSAVNTDVFWAE